jgi:hypothetical protein
MTGANQAYAKGMARMFGLPQRRAQQGRSIPACRPRRRSKRLRKRPRQRLRLRAARSRPVTNLSTMRPRKLPRRSLPAQQPQASGGAPSMGPMNLTGDPRRDIGLYVMNPEEYGKAMIGNAAKGGAPTDTEVLVAHAREALARGDVATASALLGNLHKQNYIAADRCPSRWMDARPADGRMDVPPAGPDCRCGPW